MCRYLQIYDFNFFLEPFHLVFYMGVNSIRADNLLPLIPRILNKKVANIFGQFLCVCSSSLIFLIHGYFMTFVSVRDLLLKKYEDCSNVLWRLCGAKLNYKLIKSENEGSSLNLSILCRNSSSELEGLCGQWVRESCRCARHTSQSVGCIK